MAIDFLRFQAERPEVLFGDRQITIIHHPPGRPSGEVMKYVIRDPLYRDDREATRIQEHEARYQINELKVEKERLEEQVAVLRQQVTQLNQQANMRFYKSQISEDYFAAMKNIAENRIKYPVQGRHIIQVEALNYAEIVSEIESLRNYVATLEADNQHVADYDAVLKKKDAAEQALRDLYVAAVNLLAVSAFSVSEMQSVERNLNQIMFEVFPREFSITGKKIGRTADEGSWGQMPANMIQEQILEDDDHNG